MISNSIPKGALEPLRGLRGRIPPFGRAGGMAVGLKLGNLEGNKVKDSFPLKLCFKTEGPSACAPMSCSTYLYNDLSIGP
jgi:hypothetical protein